MNISTSTAPQTPVQHNYRVLGLVSLSHAVTHMFSALMPIIYPFVMAEYGFSYAQLGFMVGLGNTVMSVLQGMYAFLMNRVLRRTLLALGNILLAISVGLMPVTGGFGSFFALNLLARASNSPQHPVGNSLVAEHFGKKMRGTAFAINFAGGNAGTVLVPALGTAGVAMLGWRMTLGIFAVFAMLTAVLSFSIPERPLLKQTDKSQESAKGKVKAAGRAWIAPMLDRNIRQVIIAAVVAAGGRGIGVVMVYVPLYLKQGLQLNNVNYAALFTIMMIGSVAGPLIVGRISDGFGRKKVVILTYALSGIATLTLLLAGRTMAYLIPAIGFLGLVVYSQSSLIQALLADVTSKESRDMAYSVFFTVSYLAGGIWSVLLGLAVDGLGFIGAFALMAGSYVAGILAVSRIKTNS